MCCCVRVLTVLMNMLTRRCVVDVLRCWYVVCVCVWCVAVSMSWYVLIALCDVCVLTWWWVLTPPSSWQLFLVWQLAPKVVSKTDVVNWFSNFQVVGVNDYTDGVDTNEMNLKAGKEEFSELKTFLEKTEDAQKQRRCELQEYVKRT